MPAGSRRGRPRAYDPDVALARILETFWREGYAGASLDALSDATGMHRPSLYAAFGDKHSLFLRALERYRRDVWGGVVAALSAEGPLAEVLARGFAVALTTYLSGREGPRGCFIVGAAVNEAYRDPAVAETIQRGLREIDAAFERLFRRAQAAGEIPSDANPAALAQTAASVMHALSVRARAGEGKARLSQMAADAVQLLAASRPPRPAP